MRASTAPAAKQAILTLLKAIPSLNLVIITWGAPTENEDYGDATEFMYFDGPVTRLPEWRVLGGNYLDETYTLTLRVQTIIPGDDRAGAETHGWELVGVIEQALRVDTTLGGILTDGGEHYALDFDEQTVSSEPHSDAWVVYATVPLICHARI